DFNQVEQILKDEGYEVIAYETYSDEPSGEIVTQIQPDSDTEVVPSETRAIFEVSIGPELVELNNLKGMTEDEATSYLEEHNLTVNVVEEHSENVPEGEVMRQSPESGTELNEDSTVDVYLSLGPEEQTPISHSVSYTVPYKTEENEEDEEKDADEEEENEDDEDEDDEDNEKKDKEEQVVRIYIDDADNDLSDV